MPLVRRDISVVCTDDVDAEVLGDAARSALGPEADVLAGLEVREGTPTAELPAGVIDRLGLRPGQANVFLRLTLPSLERTLTSAEANGLRNRICVAVHEGPHLELIAT